MISLLHPINKPRPGQIRVACVGDSITYGYLVKQRRKNCYPSVLGRLLGERYCVANFGFSGRTAVENGDHSYVKERLYRESLSWKPDMVLLMLGTNDSKPCNWNGLAYRRDMEKLIDVYCAEGSRVVLLLPPPAFPVNGAVKFDISTGTLEREVIPVLPDVAEKKQKELINVCSAFAGRRELFVDGVHPNAEGAKLLAETVYDFLAKETL